MHKAPHLNDGNFTVCVKICVTRIGMTEASVATECIPTADPPAPASDTGGADGDEPPTKHVEEDQTWWSSVDCWETCADVAPGVPVTLTLSFPDPCGGSPPANVSVHSTTTAP